MTSNSRLGSFTILFLGLVSICVLARSVFLINFGGWQSLLGEGLKAQYLGAKFDARLVAIILVPAWLLLLPAQPESASPAWKRRWAGPALVATLVVYGVLVLIAMVDDRPARPWLLAFLGLALFQRLTFKNFGLQERACAWIWMAYGVVAVAGIFVAYCVDFGTYAYIHTRLNGTLLMFMENAGMSLRMIWESYPVVWIALSMAAFLAGLVWILQRLFRHLQASRLSKGRLWAVRVGVSFLLIFIMYGRVSRYPLRWSEGFELRQALHAHAALNPVLFFLETRRDMDGGFDLDKVKASHALLASYFGCEASFENGNPSLLRTIPPRPLVTGRPNVVFIQLESLAAFKTGLLGIQINQTPFFDQLCRQGIFFDRFFVPMENTSRSMFCTLTGIPDVSAVQNATRNPLILEQNSALHALQDYDKSFHLGGSANWAQIRGILKRNFPDITIHEEGSFRAPVVDVWGVSDADLLLETHERLLEKQRPFWAYIQTSGNHPPFTVPRHFRDFQVRKLDAETLARAGFVSNEEFNGVRLIDYSLKRYFATAEKAPYFRNTIFVLWADHGVPRGYPDKRFGDMALGTYHIPFLIYAPGFIQEGRRIHTVGSQMDLMPTLMSLMGREVRTRTLGKDLLDPRWADRSVAFIFTTFRRPPAYGIVQGQDFFKRESDGRTFLFRLDDPEGKNRVKEAPARARELEELDIAFYEWAKYLLSHNKRPNPADHP